MKANRLVKLQDSLCIRYERGRESERQDEMDWADEADGFPGQPAQLSRYAVPDRICHLLDSESICAFALLYYGQLSRSRLN